MSNYRVALTASAEKELHGLPAQMVARIVPRLEGLASAPRPPGCKKLSGGDNEWRIRVITGSCTKLTMAQEPSM